VKDLIPIRYGRMLQSPFTFYRGAAALMASDLALTPNSGLIVQACGDCHLLNFGGFATPERRLVFGMNDFDETLQVKEARVAVFEPYVGRSPYANRGQRVVVGQRIMQSASDLFLGWTSIDDGSAMAGSRLPSKGRGKRRREWIMGFVKRVALTALVIATCSPAEPIPIAPQKMKRTGTVDERFQSFNVEMVEVTGGRFWAPYNKPGSAVPAETAAQPSVPGIDPNAFRNRAPIDLENPRLRKLAAALGPAYVRVSGTWANSTYFHDSDDAAPSSPPPGFGGVLTRSQWRGVVDFSRAVNAKIITSFAISAGVRDPGGLWTPVQAVKFLAFTRSIGGSIAAAEFFNEPSFASIGGAPKGYDAAAYARDFAVFLPFARKNAPGMLVLGPGSVGEAASTAPGIPLLKSEDMLKAAGPGLDAFSYHFYGAVSKRCAFMAGAPQTTPEAALSVDWLSRTARDEAFYAALRDRFEPGKPLWLTETGEAACGGNPWAASFIDSFRYLDQLGRLAKRGVQVVAHNTLSASDYALIDEETFTPRPNYWSALLWRKMMGAAVLDAGASPVQELHLYAHCLRGHPGGVALLAINADRGAAHDLAVPANAERYTLTAGDLLGNRVDLNGNELKLGANDTLPAITGTPAPAGPLNLAPASITFLAFPNAGNASCR
jgi:heparanase